MAGGARAGDDVSGAPPRSPTSGRKRKNSARGAPPRSLTADEHGSHTHAAASGARAGDGAGAGVPRRRRGGISAVRPDFGDASGAWWIWRRGPLHRAAAPVPAAALSPLPAGACGNLSLLLSSAGAASFSGTNRGDMPMKSAAWDRAWAATRLPLGAVLAISGEDPATLSSPSDAAGSSKLMVVAAPAPVTASPSPIRCPPWPLPFPLRHRHRSGRRGHEAQGHSPHSAATPFSPVLFLTKMVLVTGKTELAENLLCVKGRPNATCMYCGWPNSRSGSNCRHFFPPKFPQLLYSFLLCH